MTRGARSRLVSLLAGALALFPHVAWAAVVVTTGLVNQHEAVDGEMVQGTISVKNLGAASWSGSVSLADYQTEGTERTFPAAGTLLRSIAAWTTFEPETLTLAPGEEGRIHYAIDLPADAALKGSYWGTLMLEDLDVQEVLATSESGDGATIPVVNRSRTAIRVNVDVRANAETGVEFRSLSVVEESGRRRLQVDVGNTGDLHLRTTVRVELRDSVGSVVATPSSEPAGLYPGWWLRYQLPLDGVPAGDYEALIIADGGDDEVFGTRRRLSVP